MLSQVVPAAFEFAAKIIFGRESDPACLAMTAIVLHLCGPEQDTGRGAKFASRLSAQNEVNQITTFLNLLCLK